MDKWRHKRNSRLGGKPTNSEIIGEFPASRTRTGLAVALSLILFVCLTSMVVTTPFVLAADPGHPASSISAGTFESGDFTFPDNLTVTKFLIANGTTLYVDAINGRVGIGTDSPLQTLDVRGRISSSSLITENTRSSSFRGVSGEKLILNMHLDNDTKDYSGQGNDGDVKGSEQYAEGKFASGMLFNGSNYIEIPSHTIARIGENITVAAWVKPKENNKDEMIVFTGYMPGFWFFASDSAGHGFDVYISNSSTTCHAYGFGEISENEWYHVAFTYSGSQLKLYVNGELNGSDTCSVNISKDGPTYIGSWGGIQQFFNGTIDEVQIFNRVLSPEEIRQLYLMKQQLVRDKNYWEYDGTNTFLGNSGNVGIGTSSPSTKLEINGSVNISGSSSKLYTPEICLAGDCKTNWPGTSGSGASDRVAFWTSSNTLSYDDNFIWDNTNKWLGIGGTPTQPLHVSGNANITGTVNANDFVCAAGDCIGGSDIDESTLSCTEITGSSDVCDDDDTCSSEACTVGSDDTLSGPTVTANLDMANYLITNIGNAGTDFTAGGGLTLAGNLIVSGTGTNTFAGNSNFDSGTLYVDAANNRVGIGTTEPRYKLHVTGGQGFFDTSTNANPFTIARAYKTSNFEEIRVGVTDAVATIHYINDETENRLDFRMQNTDTEAGGGANANDNIVMSILGNTAGGNVGIGTTDPGAKLHVSGGTGSVQVLIEADTDNSGEGDQPSIKFTQDGGTVSASIGFFDATNVFEIRQEFTDDILIKSGGDVIIQLG